jgi:hypothetical protein
LNGIHSWTDAIRIAWLPKSTLASINAC